MRDDPIDTEIGEGFFDVASRLLDSHSEEAASRAHLRRAASSLYYAHFHCMSRHFANALVGVDPKGGLARAWVEAYRGLDHAACKRSCADMAAREFPEPIKQLALDMQQLYQARLSADYDPTYQIDIVTLNSLYGMVEKNIRVLNDAPERDMKALASWMLFRSAGAKSARESKGPPKSA